MTLATLRYDALEYTSPLDLIDDLASKASSQGVAVSAIWTTSTGVKKTLFVSHGETAAQAKARYNADTMASAHAPQVSDALTPEIHVYFDDAFPLVADASANGHKVTNLAPGSASTDAANFSQIGAAIAAHLAASDPHTQYLTQTEGDARYLAMVNGFVAQMLHGNTTDGTTAVQITSDGGAAGAANIWNLPNNVAREFTIKLVGRNPSTGDCARYSIDGLVKRGANAAATTVVSRTVTKTHSDSGTSGWGTPTLTADTTNGGINLSVIGVASTTLHWVARVEGTEVA